MNGARPGSDNVASPDTRNVPASTGATFWTPPYAAIARLPRLDVRKPAIRNSAAVDKPWFTMYSVEPDWP